MHTVYKTAVNLGWNSVDPHLTKGQAEGDGRTRREAPTGRSGGSGVVVRALATDAALLALRLELR